MDDPISLETGFTLLIIFAWMIWILENHNG
jgi:hypothetical protein